MDIPSMPQNEPAQRPATPKRIVWKIVLFVNVTITALLMILALPASNNGWEWFNLWLIELVTAILALITMAVVFIRGPKFIWRIVIVVGCIALFFGFWFYLTSDLFHTWTVTQTSCQEDSECVPVYSPSESCISPQEYKQQTAELEARGQLMLGASPSNICRCNSKTKKCEYADECNNFISCY